MLWALRQFGSSVQAVNSPSPGDGARRHDAGTEKLVEVLVVADLIHQLETGEHHHPRSGKTQAKDRTVRLGELDQIEDRHLASDVEQVADDRVGGRLRNGLQIRLAAHGSLLVLSSAMSLRRGMPGRHRPGTTDCIASRAARGSRDQRVPAAAIYTVQGGILQ